MFPLKKMKSDEDMIPSADDSMFNTVDIFSKWIRDGKTNALCCSDVETNVFQTEKVFTKWLIDGKKKKSPKRSQRDQRLRRSSSNPSLSDSHFQVNSEMSSRDDVDVDRKDSIIMKESFFQSECCDRRGIVFSGSVDQLNNIVINPSDRRRSTKIMSFRLYVMANYNCEKSY